MLFGSRSKSNPLNATNRMATKAHLKILKKGAAVWNQWRQDKPHIEPDLSNENIFKLGLGTTNFSGMDFTHVNFHRTYLHVFDLSSADFKNANLSEANLTSSDLSNADLREANLRGTVFRFSDLSGANLSGVDLTQGKFEDANLSEANLSEADLRAVDLREMDLSGAIFTRANLSGANLNGANLTRANLSEANLSNMDLRGVDLRTANLGKTNLSGANLGAVDLREANLNGANLTKANLSATNLSGANLREASLRGANLFNTALIRANLSGVDISGASLSGTNLAEANINGVNLSGVDFSTVDLSRVDFTGVDLSRADLRKANLKGANLSEVDLNGRNLSDTDLREADLRKANLCEANLNRANLEGADITGAHLYRTTKYDWRIEGIKCDYIFCDTEAKIPLPKDRDFRPGEFERLFKQLPTIELVLESGVTPLDAFVMDQVVQAINEKRPELELKLDSFHSGGQPHAVFTVPRREYCDEHLRDEIKAAYETHIVKVKRSTVSLKDALSVRYGGPELRKSRRFERLETVTIEKPESELLGSAQLNNFSAEGMMLRSGFAIRPGELINIRFEKPLYASGSQVVASKVVWCRDLEAHGETVSRFGIGIGLAQLLQFPEE